MNDLLAIIVNLLSTIRPEYQELAVIDQLNKYFNFDLNILLLDSSADINRFINERKPTETTSQMSFVFERVYDLFIGLEMAEIVNKIDSKNTFLIVVPESVKLERNLDLFAKLFQIEKIQQQTTNMKIGLFLPNGLSMHDLKRMFEWCWRHHIINVFVAFHSQETNVEQSLQIFTFNPFGTFDLSLVNVTGSRAFDNYFVRQNSNFQQHSIRAAEPQFTFINSKSDEILWRAVCQVLNASITEIECDFNVSSRWEFFEKNSVDLVTNVFGVTAPTVVNMYPMTMEDVVLVVPAALPFAEFSSYLRTATSSNFFGFAIVTIVAIMLQLGICRYIKKRRISLFQSIADVLNLLMNDNGSIKYRQLSYVEVCLVVPLTFTGFVIVNGILSNLQSFITRPVMQPQTNTISDIYTLPFPIMTNDEFWAKRATNVLESLSNGRDWKGKILVVENEALG